METKRRHKFSTPESKGIALTWDNILQVLDGYFHALALQRKVVVRLTLTLSLLRNFYSFIVCSLIAFVSLAVILIACSIEALIE
jgi:O-succinylbenzoate synthase